MMREPMMYKYALNLKASAVPAKTGLNTVFPHLEDLVVSSRKFDKFEDAVTSANQLVAQLAASLNQAVQTTQFRTVSEINPKHTGKPTLSTEWGMNEVAKLWIVDDFKSKDLKNGQIRAVALAQLLEVHGEPVSIS